MSREMIDTKVPWIGQIPSEWSVLLTKRLFTSIKEIAREREPQFQRLALTLNGVIQRNKNDNEGLQPEKFDTYQILYKDELVFKLIDLENIKTSRVGISLWDGLVSPAYIKLRASTDIFSYFAYFYFLSLWHLNVFNYIGGDGVRSSLSLKDLYKIPFPYPTLNHQIKIVNTINDKLIGIDKLILIQEHQIEKLKEYKQSIISKAVTKGLDENVPMKESGVEWIGEIPDDWEIHQIKNSYSVILGKMVVPNQTDSDQTEESYLCAANIQWDGVFKDVERKMWFSAKEKERFLLHKGDVLIVEGGVTVGTTCQYNDEFAPCYFQNSINCCRPKLGNDASYLYYWMFFIQFSGYVDSICSKATFQHYTKAKVQGTPFVRPNLSAQKTISMKLDRICSKISSLIQKKIDKIEKLQEFKKTLIYEYVTGKKQVV